MADSPSPLADFQAFRTRMNDVILNAGNLTINRFFALDHRCYEPGALGTKTKEMLGLVASMVIVLSTQDEPLGFREREDVDAYLMKPFEPRVLEALLARAAYPGQRIPRQSTTGRYHAAKRS